MDTEKFERLKSRAIQILYILDTLTGDGAIIHERNRLHSLIVYRLDRLKERGEEIIADRAYTYTIFYTLCGLERKLDEANQFIAKVKGVKV